MTSSYVIENIFWNSANPASPPPIQSRGYRGDYHFPVDGQELSFVVFRLIRAIACPSLQIDGLIFLLSNH